MRWWYLGLCGVAPLVGYVPSLPITDGVLQEAFEDHRFADALVRCESLIKVKDERQLAEVYLHKAIALLLNGRQVEGFETFLLALEAGKKGAVSTPSREEVEVYEQALSQYLRANVQDLKEVSLDLREVYGPILAMNPDYYLLGFLVGSAHANVGMLDDFFAVFYRSYLQYPDHYLSYKTLGHIHLQLMERARGTEKRLDLRKKVLAYFGEALAREQRDYSLYKTMIVLSRGEEKKKYLAEYLPVLLQQDLVIPRSDLYLFVKESTDSGLFDVAQALLEKGQTWYEYSRSLNAAAQYLEGRKESLPR